MITRLVFGLLFCFFSIEAISAETKQLEYEGFTVWVDCSKRAAVLFNYVASRDTGKLDRKSSFTFDPNPEVTDCQQFSTDSYQSALTRAGTSFDLGHQVPANHFDHSRIAIAQSNYMTNILPQTLSMNRGAWRATEDIIECLRDVTDLDVWGAPIWGSDRKNDYFVESHGVRTPDHFWKVIIRHDTGAGMGWIIPNGTAPYSSLDKWIRTLRQIENASGQVFSARNKTRKPAKSWAKPKKCSIQ